MSGEEARARWGGKGVQGTHCAFRYVLRVATTEGLSTYQAAWAGVEFNYGR